ncbi:MAG: hypothetical protein SW833_08465 [Cyanobacteriota bacterium]|nr:hypothetical protein [Cyanobacteriota bacterium]
MTPSTLVNLLPYRACQHLDQTAYTFLENGEKPSTTLTYRQLDQKADRDRGLLTNSTLPRRKSPTGLSPKPIARSPPSSVVSTPESSPFLPPPQKPADSNVPYPDSKRSPPMPELPSS